MKLARELMPLMRARSLPDSRPFVARLAADWPPARRPDAPDSSPDWPARSSPDWPPDFVARSGPSLGPSSARQLHIRLFRARRQGAIDAAASFLPPAARKVSTLSRLMETILSTMIWETAHPLAWRVRG